MEIFVTLLETLFIAIRTDNPKYSPTLSWWTSVFITDIENLFGPRDSTFTLVGVDMDETDNAVQLFGFRTQESRLSATENNTATLSSEWLETHSRVRR